MNQAEQATSTSKSEAQLVAVSLTAYDWHRVLAVMEFAMKFVNRDTSHAVQVYEAIATRLSGIPVIVHQRKETGDEPN